MRVQIEPEMSKFVQKIKNEEHIFSDVFAPGLQLESFSVRLKNLARKIGRILTFFQI